MAAEIKKPWLKFYDGVKETLVYPEYSLYTLWEESCKKHPDRPAYSYFGKEVSYSKFCSQIEEAAKAFKTLGVDKGDTVSICMPNTPEALISFYALNKIGAVSNMIHPLSAENEIKYYLNVSESKFVVSIDMAFGKINNIASETGLKKAIIVSVKDSAPLATAVGYMLTKGRKVKVPRSDMTVKWKHFIGEGRKYTGDTYVPTGKDDTASILYSGGTSGYPKGIRLTNLNFNSLAMQSFEMCQILREGDRVLSIMPVFHGFGLGICIHTTQYFGGCSIILPQFSAKTFDKLLTRYKPNVIAGVPTLYEALLRNKNLDGVDLSFLKCVISGGDSLSVSLKEKIDAFLKSHGADIQVREGYGLTECVTGSCLTPTRMYKKGSIGIPYPDTLYKIVKPGTDEEVPYNTDGEIVISGPSVMPGYLNEDEETSLTLKVHSDGLTWMHSGDMGCMDEDGFIYFKQRIKNCIVTSGYCIYPQYIENVIDAVPEVLMSCVIGIDHPYKVQVAKAFVVLRNGYEPNDEILDRIKKHCEKNLARYSWPYEYEFRKELPKTLVGKVAFSVLKEEEKKKRDEANENPADTAGGVENQV